MPPKLKYAEGEKVLCFHGPLIYEAKCLKTIVKDNSVRYLIHYAGWNKNWDEWVPESRVLKYNEANLQKQKDVQKAHTSKPNKSKKAPKQGGRKSEPSIKSEPSSSREVSKPSTPSVSRKESKAPASSSAKSSRAFKEPAPDSGYDQPKRKRVKIDNKTLEPEKKNLARNEVRVNIPDELKVWLVDDWDIMNRQHKLTTLPAKLTVIQILDNFLASRKTGKNNLDILPQFISGLKDYFNVTLGSQLLYKFERPQYAQALQDYPGTPMSDLYGAIHLLRLFTKIGSMLAYTSLDDKSTHHLMLHVQDFLKYMVANRAALFNFQDYENASPEYHRKLL